MAKIKKKQLSESAQQKRNQQHNKRLNPFEVHINKDKQNVLGRKSKTDRGLPGISRAKAISKRKGTLLQEYKIKNKDNLFLDKRIGERNTAMSEEDKAMARFAAERIRAHKKKNIFNLNDEEVLTHRGQTLEEIEKFDDPKSDDEFSDEENRTGKLDHKFVGEAHFGGGVLSKSETGKSRKDLIEQLIAESKKRKAEKQKIREQTIDLTEKLDSEWRDLLPIVSAANKSIEGAVQETKADDYDVAVRKLKFEARGTPSEKLKSEEEIVREEKEKLEALEADRLARMKGFVNDLNNEIKHKSADDLDDGFVVESVDVEIPNDNTNSLNHPAEDATNDDNDDNENSNEDNDRVSNKDDTESDDHNETNVDANDVASEDSNVEDNLSDLKESESSSEDENSVSTKNVTFADKTAAVSQQKIRSGSAELKPILKSTSEIHSDEVNKGNRKEQMPNDLLEQNELMEKACKELPYTYKVPASFEELETLLLDRNSTYQAVIVDRIIKCNHWSLNGNNKEKLTNLFLYLLQHINNSAIEDNVESISNCFQIFNRLSPYLYDLAHINPQSTKTFIQEIIKEKHDDFERNKKQFPNLDTLIFFKLVSLLFPTSDFRHPVVTPCIIFMSQILLRCRVKNRIDISKGLFVCTLLLEYTVLSKRFAPSVINFLRGVIHMATPKHLIQGIKIIPPFKTTGEASNLLVIEQDKSNLDIDPHIALMKVHDLACNKLDNDFKVRALLTAVNLLREFKNHLEELDAVYSIFEPILKLLKLNNFDKYPVNVRKHIKQFRKDLKQLHLKKLQYIVLEKKRPKPLKMYEPRIERVYDGKRYKTMSKAKAEREKLLHKYKKEMKGAIREIRRDSSFLAKVQIKQQIRSDTERKRKVKEIFGDAATQQSELRKIKRKK